LKDDDDNNKRGMGWNEVEKFCLFSTTGTRWWNWNINCHCVSRKFISRAACDITTVVL
jgi:hypothetical protein